MSRCAHVWQRGVCSETQPCSVLVQHCSGKWCVFTNDQKDSCKFGMSQTVDGAWLSQVISCYSTHCCRAFLDLGGGLSVGFSGLSAGFAIGIVGDAGVRGTAQQPRLFVGMILILIFAEVLGEQ